MSVRIEVCVPSFNHELFIERCLRSIFRQVRPPDRLLVIDDGSSDGTAAVAERVLADCPFPADLVVRPNRGLSATLNEALRSTQGELFAYLGSDDLWHPRRLARAEERLAEEPAAVLSFGACEIVDAEDRVIEVWGRNYHRPSLTVRDLLSFRSVPISCTVTYRRSAIEKYGWNESSVQEDYEVYLRLAASGTFAYVDEPLGSWRAHSRNTTRNLDVMLREVLETQRRLSPELGIDRDELEIFRQRVEYAYGGDYLRLRQRRRAISLTLRNLSAAPSSRSLIRRLLGLSIPFALLEQRRRAMHHHRPLTSAVDRLVDAGDRDEAARAG